MTKKIISSWQRLVNLLKLDKKDVLQVVYYAVFAGLVSLSLPLGIQAIINLIQGAQISTSWIVLVVLVTVGVVFAGLLQLMQFRIIENIQQKIFTRASFEFAYRFPKIKMSELRNYYPPELANRFFDVLTIQKGISKLLIDFPAALLQIIFGLILLSFYHAFFIIYGFLLVILIYVLFKFSVQRGLLTSLDESKNKYKVAHWIQEVARSIVSFKLSGRTSLAMNKNDALVSKYLEARESHFKILIFQFVKMIGFKVLVTAGLLLIGGLLVLNQEMNIGQFVAAEIIILLIIASVEKLITGLETVYDVLTSLEKLGQVVDKEIESQEGKDPLMIKEELAIELDEIEYVAPLDGKRILDGITLKIPPKSRILIQGSNGSGKTTLLRIIAGILEPTYGTIYANDVSLKTLQLNQYRSLIGQSLTEETPFEGTILENITFGDSSIPMEDVFWALENTGLSKFVKSSDNGLETMLYPEGKQLSHSLSKKIVLARSIVSKPKLLILKEPLDLLDVKDQDKIIDFLLSPERPWSLVVVSQNPKWEKGISNKITIENGKIV